MEVGHEPVHDREANPGVMNKVVRPEGPDRGRPTRAPARWWSPPPPPCPRGPWSPARRARSAPVPRSARCGSGGPRSVSAVTGRKVSRPTTSSTVATPIPASRSASKVAAVRCSPAVGAAAEAARRAKTVWYRSGSSRHCLDVGRQRHLTVELQGCAAAPRTSVARLLQLPRAAGAPAIARLRGPLPSRIAGDLPGRAATCPGRSFRLGRQSASQVPSPQIVQQQHLALRHLPSARLGSVPAAPGWC